MDGGNEYVIQVKRNQIFLRQGIIKTIKEGPILDQFEKVEMNKGRRETRRVRVYKKNDRHISKDWESVNRIIEVINSGTREGAKYEEKHYYISSLKENKAEIFGNGIRNHWAIENKLHRVKDVIQNEDNCLIEEKRIAANLSIIKSVTISLFKLNGYYSIKKALERFRNRVSDCGELIGIISI